MTKNRSYNFPMVEARLKGLPPEQMPLEQASYDIQRAGQDMMGADVSDPFQPGVDLKAAITDKADKYLNQPLASRGWPNLGAALATVPAVASDVLVPETKGDVLGMVAGPVKPTEMIKLKQGLAKEISPERLKKIFQEVPELAADPNTQDFQRGVWKSIMDSVYRARAHGGKEKLLGSGLYLNAYDVGDDVVVKLPKTSAPSQNLEERFIVEQMLAFDDVAIPSMFMRDFDTSEALIQDKLKATLHDDLNQISKAEIAKQNPNISEFGHKVGSNFEAGIKGDLIDRSSWAAVGDLHSKNIGRLTDGIPIKPMRDAKEFTEKNQKYGYEALFDETNPIMFDDHGYKITDAGEYDLRLPRGLDWEEPRWRTLDLVKQNAAKLGIK
jgi:hypothetical protein